MRCVIARYPFELTKDGVLALMAGVTPEPVTGDSVTIGRRRYPVMQVGAVITRQDRRDFTGGEVTRAMARLGFTCHSGTEAVPRPAPGARSALDAAAELFGHTGPRDA
ncbi:SCO5918 family protein [Streptomyces cylindrosporus]|uniref:SCO5918 family protein n=1 Tax=Streptomyces cylindrosporus TaxID=2927583 RepID=A0ABS9YCE8_9ACTN|nr:SCO5918 family protein [Streptomyces cylindrosporus]MCI3274911.1 SCO5918 family protein [Streptomyces cylindrosporus]